MNVRMAVRALRADFLEIQIRMAVCAIHLRVHSAQRIAGLIVIELGVGANWFPTRVGVALLAWNRKGSVRIGHLGLRAARLRFLRRLLQRQAGNHRRKDDQNPSDPAPTRHRTLRILQRRAWVCLFNESVAAVARSPHLHS